MNHNRLRANPEVSPRRWRAGAAAGAGAGAVPGAKARHQGARRGCQGRVAGRRIEYAPNQARRLARRFPIGRWGKAATGQPPRGRFRRAGAAARLVLQGPVQYKRHPRYQLNQELRGASKSRIFGLCRKRAQKTRRSLIQISLLLPIGLMSYGRRK
jgi:hypothetical protein